MESCTLCGIYYDDGDHFPSLMECGHSVCNLCIKTLKFKACPICNEKFNKVVKNLNILGKIENAIHQPTLDTIDVVWIIHGQKLITTIPMTKYEEYRQILTESTLSLLSKAVEQQAVELSLDFTENDIKAFSNFLNFYVQNHKLYSGTIEELNSIDNFIRLGLLNISSSIYANTKQAILSKNEIVMLFELDKALLNILDDSCIWKSNCDLKINTGNGKLPICFRPGYQLLLRKIMTNSRTSNQMGLYTQLSKEIINPIIEHMQQDPIIHGIQFKYIYCSVVPPTKKEECEKELLKIKEKLNKSIIIITNNKLQSKHATIFTIKKYCELESAVNDKTHNYMADLANSMDNLLDHCITAEGIVQNLNEFAEHI